LLQGLLTHALCYAIISQSMYFNGTVHICALTSADVVYPKTYEML